MHSSEDAEIILMAGREKKEEKTGKDERSPIIFAGKYHHQINKEPLSGTPTG